jgi:hypothetical protein
MSHSSRPLLAALAATAVALLCGCGAASHDPAVAPSARLVGATTTSPGEIVVTQLGAQRIGLQTAPVKAIAVPPPKVTTTIVHGVKHTTTTPAPPPTDSATMPYSAIVYDPTGRTYAFTRVAANTFREVGVTVDRIDGSTAYLKNGPKPGVRVVTVGAEELYGVQSGVLAQT